jgi:hypothetical protein
MLDNRGKLKDGKKKNVLKRLGVSTKATTQPKLHEKEIQFQIRLL